MTAVVQPLDQSATARRKQRREFAIENAIIDRPKELGFPDALALRNWKVAPHFGRCDVGLLPVDDPVRLVLVEAKVAKAPDAPAECVGQLIMYYVGALQLGIDGLKKMKMFAANHQQEIRDGALPWISLRMLAETNTNPEAWRVLSRGRSLKRSEIKLFLGLDGDPPQSLEPILNCLRDLNLSIGLVVVKDGKIVRVDKPQEPGC